MIFAAAIFTFHLSAFAQQQQEPEPGFKRPKLIVGIVVDQMRYDFLYRYQDRYGSGGFNRMLRTGFSAENMQIPYAQTVTAAGHACVYTGTTPALNGIMGNEWYDREKGRNVYCVEDDQVKIIGGGPKAEPMSPRNLWTTTVTDELRLATNFRSKVVGVAIKDRGSILPAGHFGTAYWYDGENSNFVTSDYYLDALPGWAVRFNNRKMADSLYKTNWATLYPVDTYLNSDDDDTEYEGRIVGAEKATFPHNLTSFSETNYGVIRATPHGNTITLEFAKAAMRGENLGKGEFTDFLAISLSSPDYIGHQYGPNSIEIEDTYLRLDKDLESFFQVLDREVGEGEYLVFLTADHGVAHIPAYLNKHKYEVTTIGSNSRSLGEALKAEFGIDNLVEASGNYHLYLNHKAIEEAKADKGAIERFIIRELKKEPYVLNAFAYDQFDQAILPAPLKEKFALGYNPKFSGDIQVIMKPGFFFGGRTGTTHGSWYPYDAHIPGVFMGWGVKPGKTNRPTTMADIAPTISSLLNIQMPNASIGEPIFEITDPKY